jgi:hypothetical protein
MNLQNRHNKFKKFANEWDKRYSSINFYYFVTNEIPYFKVEHKTDTDDWIRIINVSFLGLDILNNKLNEALFTEIEKIISAGEKARKSFLTCSNKYEAFVKIRELANEIYNANQALYAENFVRNNKFELSIDEIYQMLIKTFFAKKLYIRKNKNEDIIWSYFVVDERGSYPNYTFSVDNSPKTFEEIKKRLYETYNDAEVVLLEIYNPCDKTFMTESHWQVLR